MQEKPLRTSQFLFILDIVGKMKIICGDTIVFPL